MKMEELQEWKALLEKHIQDTDKLNTHLRYISFFRQRDLPVIFEFEHLAKLMGITNTFLAAILNSPKAHYRVFNIPKKRGGTRAISSPTPSLLECQRWIKEQILDKFPLSNAAHGFIKNRSIITHARSHVGERALLKIDIKNFFSSISNKRVFYFFRRIGYPPKISYFLSSICCLEGCLPQGGATSPALSNLITKQMDKRLSGLIKCYDLKYSRYADDLAFSGKFIPLSFLERATEIICEEGFTLNEKKTSLIHGRGKRILTGISIAGGKLSLPRSTKRKLRQESYFLLKNGLLHHMNQLGEYDPLYIERLLGKLNFWYQIEPSNKFVLEHINKIKNLKNETF